MIAFSGYWKAVNAYLADIGEHPATWGELYYAYRERIAARDAAGTIALIRHPSTLAELNRMINEPY